MKSLTVVAAHLLNDEVAYQAMVLVMSMEAQKLATSMAGLSPSEISLAMSTVRDAELRLKHAAKYENIAR